MAAARQAFISHVFEERHAALVLRKYVRDAFKDVFPVFAAFDKESIGGGTEWFHHIIENLGKSAVVPRPPEGIQAARSLERRHATCPRPR
jgi:hypothetical protein